MVSNFNIVNNQKSRLILVNMEVLLSIGEYEKLQIRKPTSLKQNVGHNDQGSILMTKKLNLNL